MWNNSELKQNGWNVLKRFGYWTPFFVCIVSGMLSNGSSGGSSSSLSESYDSLSSSEPLFSGIEGFFEELSFLGAIAFVLLLLASALALTIFVGGPIVVGEKRFFMEHREGGAKFKKLFWAFGCGNYLNVVKVMFFYNIKIFLWTLLFIIPGIIKSYEYFMVPYILAENPGMDSEDVFELSKKMTDGDKFNIFLLSLSFIGWILLGVITCGIGLIFLDPYIEATFAELYNVKRNEAKIQNFPGSKELPGFGFEKT